MTTGWLWWPTGVPDHWPVRHHYSCNCIHKHLLLEEYTCIRGVTLEAMLDSGSTISLLHQDVVSRMHNLITRPHPSKRLVMASGHPLEVVGCVLLSVSLQGKPAVLHEFVIVPDLIIAAILGVDFFATTCTSIGLFNRSRYYAPTTLNIGGEIWSWFKAYSTAQTQVYNRVRVLVRATIVKSLALFSSPRVLVRNHKHTYVRTYVRNT